MHIEINYGAMPIEHIRNASRLHYRELKAFWIMVLAVMILGSVALFWPGLELPLFSAWAPGLFCIACWGLVYPLFYITVVIPRGAVKRLAELGDLHIVIDDTGICETAAAAKMFCGWEAVKSYKEDRNGFNIYFAGGLFVHVPRQLLSHSELEDLERKLAAQVSKA